MRRATRRRCFFLPLFTARPKWTQIRKFHLRPALHSSVKWFFKTWVLLSELSWCCLLYLKLPCFHPTKHWCFHLPSVSCLWPPSWRTIHKTYPWSIHVTWSLPRRVFVKRSHDKSRIKSQDERKQVDSNRSWHEQWRSSYSSHQPFQRGGRMLGIRSWRSNCVVDEHVDVHWVSFLRLGDCYPWGFDDHFIVIHFFRQRLLCACTLSKAALSLCPSKKASGSAWTSQRSALSLRDLIEALLCFACCSFAKRCFALRFPGKLVHRFARAQQTDFITCTA